MNENETAQRGKVGKIENLHTESETVKQRGHQQKKKNPEVSPDLGKRQDSKGVGILGWSHKWRKAQESGGERPVRWE